LEAASISYAVLRIFDPMARGPSWRRRSKMGHFLTGDEKFRDLIHDDDDRSYRVARTKAASGYRFGRTRASLLGVRARAALSRVNGYLTNMIEAAAEAKLRRMERELELRGIRLDRSDDNWPAEPELKRSRESN
jgi:hypothetical protein